MIQNYLKIAWRHLLKNKAFSFINILGLAIGIAACIIIFLYVHNELTYDRYNAKADRIARITITLHAPGSDVVLAVCPAPLADELQRGGYPELESAARLESAPTIIKSNNSVFREEAFYKADPAVFSIFSFDFLEGGPAGALKNPNTVVITSSIAKKYFGNRPALGKILPSKDRDLLITGVVKDRPANSDMHIDALLSTEFSAVTSWVDDFSIYSFVLFRNKPDLGLLKKQLAGISKKYVQPELNKADAANYSVEFDIEPLTSVHFSQGKLQDSPKGNRQFSYIFSVLALFILLIALLNYINLSTAKSAERAREVGIRKVSGAGKFQLVGQFLFESFLLITIAWLLGIATVQLSLPVFNKLLQTSLSVNWRQDAWFILSIFGITLLLSGLYPAFVLSSFIPIKVLKGNWRNTGKGIFLRKLVIVTQFSIAAALIMGTTVIYRQMKFIRTKDLGFNKDQLLNIYLPRDSAYMNTVKVFQQALRQRTEVSDLTVGNGMTDATFGSTFAESAGKKREMMANFWAIDPHFLPVFQVQLLEGRNISDSFSTDKQEAFLVNEAFVKTMGWKSAIGKSMEGFYHKGKVVGVVKNFYYRSLHNLVEPTVLVYNTFPANTTTIKIKPGDLPVVKEIYTKLFPAVPFDYAFFDDIVARQYAQDNITMSLFNDFTLLAIFVSCLGLYGLVALIAVQRMKEISIRKVLGASIQQLLSLLTKDFVKLALLAMVISLPLAGLAMHKWLGSYAYHIPLSWWMFLIPILLLIVITLAVISKEVIKAALVNPVKSLRTE